MRIFKVVCYEEIENLLDEAYVKEVYEKGKAFSFIKRFVVGMFFSFGAIAPGLFSRMVINDVSSSPIPLDVNNLYQYLIPPTSIILIVGLIV